MTAVTQEFPVRGLYTQAALLAHECIGNTFVAVDNAKQLKVYSSVDIKAGQAIYNCYTAILYVRTFCFQFPPNYSRTYSFASIYFFHFLPFRPVLII